MSAPVACSVCSKRDALSYFKVERVAQDGTASQLTTVCSVKCMAGWLYQYANMQSMRLIYGAKSAIEQLKSFFKP